MSSKKPKPSDDACRGRYGEYRLVNGKMHWHYEVYLDGQIRMPQFRERVRAFNADTESLDALGRFFSSFILSETQKLTRRKDEFWRDIRSELKLIAPKLSADEILSFDHDTGFLKIKEKAPSPNTAPDDSTEGEPDTP